MPIQINIEKAKNIFQKNLQSSLNKEIEKLDIEIKEEDNDRLIELQKYFKDFKVDLTEVETIADIDRYWPNVLPYKSHDPIFQKTYDALDNIDPETEVLGCELGAGPFISTRVLSGFNVSFILNTSAWNNKFIPQPDILDKNENYNYFYGWHQQSQKIIYSISGENSYSKKEEMFKLKYANKRILLKKQDNSVIIITPVNLRIELEELIAKLSYIPEKNKWAYSEVFNVDELPSEKYRDAWELIGYDQETDFQESQDITK